MDLWLIAATVATGYITKHLQNATKGKDRFHESSSEDLINVKPESPRCLTSRLVTVKKPIEENSRDCVNGDNSDAFEFGNAYGLEVTLSNEENLGNNDEIHSDSLLSSMPESLEDKDEMWATSDVSVGDKQTNSFRNRAFLRRNRQYSRLIKPFPLESGVMSRFQKMSMEDYMCSPFPSPCASRSRPLLVTDGKKVISRNTEDSISQQVQLRKIESSGLYIKRRVGNEKHASRRSNYEIGSNDEAMLLCVGISIGILSSFAAKQNKVNKFKQALKQTENSVQDLEDELEMKESTNIKKNDIDCEDNDEKQCDEKAEEDSESISKIEAELEAELERLEINMSSSNNETRFSDAIELDPDFEVEFAQGELRADRVKEQTFNGTKSNQEDRSDNSTPESGNYTVSARELSLRLYEVINSRLEKRIKELEIALHDSQTKVEQLVMESEDKKGPLSRLLENLDNGSFSGTVSVEHIETKNPAEIQPLVMNLAGEALDAFNESYEELMEINDYSEEYDSPFEMQENGLQEELCWSHKDDLKDYSRTAEDMKLFRLQDLLDVGLSEEEEDSELENEMQKELIKQIVEKTKQGSPVVLNAQKMLFLMEEREQNL